MDERVGSAYLLATKDGIVEEGKFRLTDGPIVFAAEVHAIKEAISDALRESFQNRDRRNKRFTL